MPNAAFKHCAVYWAGDQGPVAPPSGGWVCVWWTDQSAAALQDSFPR